jgi:hypothetical protein
MYKKNKELISNKKIFMKKIFIRLICSICELKISDRISSKIIVVGNILEKICMTSGKELNG